MNSLVRPCLLKPGATLQLQDADVRVRTVHGKLNGGLDVAAAVASQVVPDPMSLNELRRWAIAKWLALEKRLRLPVRQLLGQGAGLISRQRCGVGRGAAASEQRQYEGNYVSSFHIVECGAGRS